MKISGVFWISIPERDPDPLAQYLRLSQTRHNWDWTIECLSPIFADKYNFYANNCQDFVAVFQRNAMNWR